MGLPRRHLQLLRHGEILVDAHNLCHRDERLHALMLEDPERARRALERRLAGRHSQEQAHRGRHDYLLLD